MMPKFFFIAFLSGLTSFVLIRIVIFFAHKKKILVVPNKRSVHLIPTPALGALGFVTIFYITILITWTLFFQQSFLFLKVLLLSIPIFVCGVLDDFRELSVLLRLSIQTFMASVSYVLGFKIEMIQLPFLNLDVNIFSCFVSVFFIVAMTNLFNFIDGLDGYLAGNSCIALTGLCFCFLANDQLKMAFICFVLISNLMGFLFWNFPKAKIFMGNAGSYFLGFFIALMSMLCDMNFSLSLVIPLIMFSVIIFDASLTLIIRFFQKKKVWEPHQEHEYQKLFYLIKSQKKVVLFSYIHTFLLVLLGILYSSSQKHVRLTLLIFCLLSLIIKYISVYYYYDKCRKKESLF